MINLIAGLKDRCERYRELEMIRKQIASAQVAYNREKKERYLADIEKGRYALEMVLDVLVDIRVITEAEKKPVGDYYGCQ